LDYIDRDVEVMKCVDSGKQDRQALHKAKYCPRIAGVTSAGSNKVALSSE